MTTKVAFISNIPTDAVPFVAAANSINEKNGKILEFFLQTGADSKDFENVDDLLQFATASHFVIVHMMGQLPCYQNLLSALEKANVPVFVASSSLNPSPEFINASTVENNDYQNILKYLNYGGKKNFENLFLYISNRFTGKTYDFDPPTALAWQGIYHPDFSELPSIDEYLSKKIVNGKPTIGLWFHQVSWQANDLDYVDFIIENLESKGVNVLAVFFSGAKDPKLGVKSVEWIIENYFMKNGKALVDAVISVLSFSLSTLSCSDESTKLLTKLDVPVIKAVLTVNRLEAWQESIQGLHTVEIASNIAMPEFDGMLITVPVAAMKYSEVDPTTGTKIIKYEPIPERVDKLVRLTINWAKLKFIPNEEKKVAIIFHNYPPRNDLIGHAFGLDSPVSVWNILRDLQKAGIKLNLPENGKEIIDKIINGLTNDNRWASAQELAERAAAKVFLPTYGSWFSELPMAVQEKMENQWNEPPGSVFTYNDQLLISGLINKNVFIGLQPRRGYFDDPASVYHSPDLPIPHQYYAYYRWIRDVFKANVILHIGKHGTLEWLPGKSIGLSASCFPDVAISDLPNVYPYIINNPGEGTQAKRRSYCCIIEHLVPVMHNADSYEELAKLEIQLKDYYHAKTSDTAKLPTMQKLIWGKVCESNLDHDLKVDEKTVFKGFDSFVETLHDYLHELSDAQIRDGLHILGEPPEGSRLEEFLVALTRLSNGSVASLRQAIAEMKGYNYEYLLANRGKLLSDGKTNGDVINEVHNLCLELVKQFHVFDFDTTVIPVLTESVLGKLDSNVEKCLVYISSFLVPALFATTDELKYVFCSCTGKYVPSGPSGSPTRGMADILPTGRNFYSVDPRAVPSSGAWKVGVDLGDALLKRYLKEEGKYPENVAIIVWATDTMKTQGDDVAEVLYLMGIKPVWEETSGRVTGLEVIPLETLKRPRVDVTLRISGMFRDAFPNIVNLIDEAVELVATLKESPEQNFLAKHVLAEIEERVSHGVSLEQAKEEACYRIFGDRPGAHGSGVSEAVDTKNWKTQKDLSDIYVTWGCYAYGRKNYGKSVPNQFKLRLSKIDVTVKNQDSREYDILDADDWYDIHGGLICSIKTFKGEAPRSYCGDSSDPDRVKLRNTDEETKFIFRSRLLNPKWIESEKRHGYQGAGDLSRAVDYVFGWDATVEVVEDWMYENLAEKYVLDKKMQEWFKEVNPYALQNMVERFLEAIDRGLWNAADDMKNQLQRIYLDIEGLIEKAGESK